MKLHNLIRYTVIAVLAAILFFPFLGQVHLFDWDEINFAECAREMIATGDYLRVQIDFQPFWEKPPLFIWMQVLSMKLFGVSEYAARFPNAFMGVVTLVSLYYMGKRLVSEKAGFWWTLLYAATWLPHFYFKSGIIDPTFNFFIFAAFFQFHLIKYGSNKTLHGLLAGILLGLAVLTKGPVAILIALLCFAVYLVINKGLWGYKLSSLLVVAAAALIPFALWFGTAMLVYGYEYGSWFIHEFIVYQIRLFTTEDADHGGPFFYHFLVLLLGCFPASVFLFQYTRKRVTDSEQSRDFTRLMWVLFWVTLLLFSIVKTKIVHYSSLCYFPLTYLAAVKIVQLDENQIRLKELVRALLLIIGSLVALLILLLPFVGIYKRALIPLIDDPFAVGNLAANVPWSWTESLWGALYLIGIWVSVYMMKKNFRKGMLTLSIVHIIIIQVAVLHFTPKIEAYSQRAAVAFFKTLRGKDVYVRVLGYKSYAHLFYTMKQKPVNPLSYDEQWLLNGPVDKPTYFVCKIIAAEPYRKMPQLQELYEMNGFVFFKRK
jgi:4-amino-4-deoxy-L-arabinose transferase-like glycosyltransferase